MISGVKESAKFKVDVGSYKQPVGDGGHSGTSIWQREMGQTEQLPSLECRVTRFKDDLKNTYKDAIGEVRRNARAKYVQEGIRQNK